MKLSVLLVTLLALSWAFAEDLKDDETFSEQKDDNDLQAELGDEVPKIRMARGAYKYGPKANLKWVWYNGKMPKNVFRIWNSHTHRYEYLCLARCISGSSLGSNYPCYYAKGSRELYARRFKVLVNKNNFEILQWKSARNGEVTENAVKSPCGTTYVGRNKLGMGNIIPRKRAFFFGWRGKTKWFRNYKVLTVNMDVVSQRLTHVKYDTTKMRVYRSPRPSTLRSASAKNYQCRPVKQTVTLTKAVSTEDRWDVSTSVALSVSTTVTAGIPLIGSAEVTVGLEASVSTNKGTSKVTSTEHSVSVEVTIPSHHSCRVDMEANKYRANIPFRALLTRKYRNGRTTSTWIRGHYKKQQIAHIQAVVQRCRKLAGRKC